MRVTTNMVRRNYSNNLSSTLSGLEQSRLQVQTGRRFSKSFEDPAAAARGSILESRYARNADYLDAVEDTQKWQDTQEDIIKQVNNMVKEIDRNYSTAAMTDTAGDVGRTAYAANLRELQKSMVYALNTKYGSAYAMAGTDGANPPFGMEGGKITYHGLDVNDAANADVLKELSNETAYVDLGFGLTFGDDGNIVSSSAFNSSFPGINVVGYGKTEDGTSKNLIVLAGQMADLLEDPKFDKEAYSKLWGQFHTGAAEAQNQLTKVGTKSQLLSATKEKLDNEKLNIDEQYKNAVGIDEAEAILNYSWAQYVYNAALKVGTSIISPSLLDFMK